MMLTSCWSGIKLCMYFKDPKKHHSQTVLMRQNIWSILIQYHLPTDINNIRSCHQNVMTTHLYFIHLLNRHLKQFNFTPCKELKCYLLPVPCFLQHLSFHMIGCLPLCPPVASLLFSLLIFNVWGSVLTQKCGNLVKTATMQSLQPYVFWLKTCLNKTTCQKAPSNSTYALGGYLVTKTLWR